jgi:hypothetical protein
MSAAPIFGADLVPATDDQRAVAGRDEIELDIIGAVGDRLGEGVERVLRA